MGTEQQDTIEAIKQAVVDADISSGFIRQMYAIRLLREAGFLVDQPLIDALDIHPTTEKDQDNE